MERRVLKRIAIEFCKSCTSQGQQGCKKSEVDASKDGRIILPSCMIHKMDETKISQKNIFEYSSVSAIEPKPEPEPESELRIKPEKKPDKESGWKGFFEVVTEEPRSKLRVQKPIESQGHELKRPTVAEPEKELKIPIGMSTRQNVECVECIDAPFKNWNETYTRILHCIKDHHTIGSMSKVLNIPRSTIRDKLTKLETKEIITKSETTLLGNKCANFIITSGWAIKLVHSGSDEPLLVVNKPHSKKVSAVKFTRHSVSLQAEIISGTIPKGDRSYSPNGWTGEIFEGNGTYTIRIIPNRKGTTRAVIDISLNLGASSPADLTMKYHSFAERYLGTWAEKHGLKLGQITEYRTPHTPIEGSQGLAQTIINAVGGETKLINYGIQVDKSDKEHQGEVEFVGKKGEETLRNFEFALNQSPEKMERLESKFDALRDTLHTEAKRVGNGITEIQGWLILQRENDLLREQIKLDREQIQLYREQMTELTKQVNEMKVMLGLTPKPPQATKSKYDEVGIYG